MRVECMVGLGMLVSGLHIGAVPVATQGHETIGSERWEYLRVLEVLGAADGPLMFYSTSAPRREHSDENPAAERFLRLPIDLGVVLNSSRPWGWNDGALWAGNGVSGALSSGVRFRRGPVTLTAAPTVWFAQNSAFDTVTATGPGQHPLGYPWANRIDLPQRFGDGAVARLDPGQSGVRLDWRSLTTGLSTENLWWGPAARHPILMGASAPGFPHIDLGLRPATSPIGSLEARVIWGQLRESAFFDSVPDNGNRLIAGVLAAWQPRWVPGLTLGAQRVFYQEWTDTLGLADFFAIVQPFTKDAVSDSSNIEGNDARDQLLSLTWRWLLPESGFEVYGEWARNDHNRNWRGFILEPDHSQAWMAGLQKAFATTAGPARLQFEFLHLGRPTTFQVRATPPYYVHHLVRQGYTHQGQILGAGPGTGADAQYAAFDRWLPRGRWGFWVERVRWSNDDYYRLFGATRFRLGHNVTLEAGARYSRYLGSLRLAARASLIRELNRHFVIENDAWHVNVQFGANWDW